MKTKMLALFAVLVLSVALAGTAYAAWTTSVTIGGTIQAGSLAVKIDASESSPNIAIDSDTDSAVQFSVTNVYPGWEGLVTITVTNTGSLRAVTTIAAPVGSGLLAAETSWAMDSFTNDITNIPVGGVASVTYKISIDSDAPNSLMGASASYTLPIEYTVGT